jgi:hypothetical protein
MLGGSERPMGCPPGRGSWGLGWGVGGLGFGVWGVWFGVSGMAFRKGAGVQASEEGPAIRCQANMARIKTVEARSWRSDVKRTWHVSRQSKPDSGLGLQVKIFQLFELFPLRSAAGLRTRDPRAPGN